MHYTAPSTHPHPVFARAPNRGFTLMEVIVAIALLALVTAISWRGLDAMMRTQSTLQERSQSLAVTKTSLDQWTTDLNAIANIPNLTAIDWDGKVFRITRTVGHSGTGQAPAVQVVAWSDRTIGGQRYWSRWHSPSFSSRDQWQSAWVSAQEWGRQGRSSASTGEVVLIPIAQWEIFYNRGGSWVNPQSSQQDLLEVFRSGRQSDKGNSTETETDSEPSVTSSTTRSTSLPNSIRLRVQIAPSQTVNGWVTTDWLNPLYSGARL